MKIRNFLVPAVAALALAACNKDQGRSTTATNDSVTITQANPPPGGNWSDVVNATSAGFMMGNPNAKVKLVEIGALTCPHCREFDEKGVPALIEKYVKSGQVSYEFRPYLLHGLDLPANLIARCNGVKTFFPLARALYHDQPEWIAKIQAAPQAQVEQVQSLPVNQQFVELARLAGLQEWAAVRGVPQAKSEQCLRDEKTINQLVQQTSDVNAQFGSDFQGTPSFLINGELLKDTATWEKLEPQLKDAVG
jgi:protein-disulfide isomerase